MPGLSDPDVGAVFAALADPTRRQVVRSLSGAEPAWRDGTSSMKLCMVRDIANTSSVSRGPIGVASGLKSTRSGPHSASKRACISIDIGRPT